MARGRQLYVKERVRAQAANDESLAAWLRAPEPFEQVRMRFRLRCNVTCAIPGVTTGTTLEATSPGLAAFLDGLRPDTKSLLFTQSGGIPALRLTPVQREFVAAQINAVPDIPQLIFERDAVVKVLFEFTVCLVRQRNGKQEYAEAQIAHTYPVSRPGNVPRDP